MKYLYISGGDFDADYAASLFEQNFKGDRLELWNKAHAAGVEQDYEDEENDLYFGYEALEMDEKTVLEIQARMDYDNSKHADYFKVEQ